jgi:hypothetical protein
VARLTGEQEAATGGQKGSRESTFYSHGHGEGMERFGVGAQFLVALGAAERRRAHERRVGDGRMHVRGKAEVPAAASAAAWPGRGAGGLFGCGCLHEMRHGGVHAELWLDGRGGECHATRLMEEQRRMADGGRQVAWCGRPQFYARLGGPCQGASVPAIPAAQRQRLHAGITAMTE